MRKDNFRKCSSCHRVSEIFQCVINRRMNTSYFSLKAILKTISRMESIGQIYNFDMCYNNCDVLLNCDMIKALEQDF